MQYRGRIVGLLALLFLCAISLSWYENKEKIIEFVLQSFEPYSVVDLYHEWVVTDRQAWTTVILMTNTFTNGGRRGINIDWKTLDRELHCLYSMLYISFNRFILSFSFSSLRETGNNGTAVRCAWPMTMELQRQRHEQLRGDVTRRDKGITLGLA